MKLNFVLPSITCLLLFIGAANTVFAQSKYYVATTGSDANSGTSVSAPFATLAKAVAVAIVPGDTIFVRSGTYTVATTISIKKPGTAAKHIVLTAYKPDLVTADSRPVFDFSSMTLSSSNRGISLSGANYWDIYGIIIKGAGDNGMNVSSTSNTKIEFCSFTRNRDTGLQLGGGSNNIYIINCDSYENADLGTGSTTSGGNADGFAAKLDIGDNIIFRGCRAWMNSDDGWDGYMRPSNPTPPTNVKWRMEDCWAFRNGYYWLDNSTTSSMNGNGFKTGGSDTKDLDHDCTMIKCLAFLNKSNGFDQNSNAGSIYMYNCSSYKNSGKDYFMTSTPTYVAGAQLVVQNSLSLGSNGVSFPAAATATRALTNTHNSFKTSITSTEIVSFDTTGVTNPRSLDGSLPVSNFMQLNTTVAAPYTYIDQGTNLSSISYHDALGIPFIGAAPDLGAFESNLNTLPVQLITFTANPNSQGVLLNWTIANQLNNKGWAIERSNTSTNNLWTEIGFVNGDGNSTAVKTYNFHDSNTYTGSNYFYRLKQIDANGQITYSHVVVVYASNNTAQLQLLAYPNPTRNNLTVQYQVASLAQVRLAIYNLQGVLVQSLVNAQQAAGRFQQNIATQQLPAGKYWIQLAIGEQMTIASFVKQ
ncbi:MAG: T9SS type A sorting domain-containing protein [Flavobacterium sp.]|nr:T9SS type A sorting domain-containing protein [Flavobacterium sp.]